MPFRHPRALWTVALGVALGAALMAGSCAKGYKGVLPPNQRPIVAFSQSPPPAGTPTSYQLDLSWTAHDPDGRVDHYLYAIDPVGGTRPDTEWVSTTENRGTFTFRADSIPDPSTHLAERVHVFVLKAVDERGLTSAPVWIGFTSANYTPSVQFVAPIPRAILPSQLGPTFAVTWSGVDLDGQRTQKPVSYRIRVIGPSDPDLSIASVIADPDTLRRRYAPAFAGWDSLPGDQTTLQLSNQTVGSQILIAIVAVDEAGGYTPVFDLNSNVLLVEVTSLSSIGPVLTLQSDTFSHVWVGGGFFSAPETWGHAEFAAGAPTFLQWSSSNPQGDFTEAYRWAVDLDQLDDERPRSDEDNDLAHWSRWGISTSELLPAYDSAQPSSTHFFYLEARDTDGRISLGILEFLVVRPSFTHDLLVVNDTFFPVDTRQASGCSGSAHAAWPAAAELDTFLYAVGNKPMRCDAAGTMSPAGLFAGYSFDTISTHTVPPGTLSLALFAQYRNVIWMVDGREALNNSQPPGQLNLPMPYLRSICQPGSTNPVVTYAHAGGHLWFMGGGSMLASLRDYDQGANGPTTFSAALGELSPSRLMWSLVHWESETKQTTSFRARRFASGSAPGGASYTELPVELAEKNPDDDPLPPLNPYGAYYLSTYAAEYLSQPNSILEESAGGQVAPALDTLYTTEGGFSGSGWPIMTVYHGSEAPLTIFSGFPLWYFSRPQSISLVDFVLQRLWGLSRRPVPR